jgi:hypothetical protein
MSTFQTAQRRNAKLVISYEPISRLRLDPKNPRLHSRKQARQIANSIASFGFNVPVLIASFWARAPRSMVASAISVSG